MDELEDMTKAYYRSLLRLRMLGEEPKDDPLVPLLWNLPHNLVSYSHIQRTYMGDHANQPY